jgi:hypothetical protein
MRAMREQLPVKGAALSSSAQLIGGAAAPDEKAAQEPRS